MVSYMYKMNDYTDYVYFVLGGMKDENESEDEFDFGDTGAEEPGMRNCCPVLCVRR